MHVVLDPFKEVNSLSCPCPKLVFSTTKVLIHCDDAIQQRVSKWLQPTQGGPKAALCNVSHTLSYCNGVQRHKLEEGGAGGGGG